MTLQKRVSVSTILSLFFFAMSCLSLAYATSDLEETFVASGPMPGYSAMRAVSIWMQGSGSGEATLEYWLKGQSDQSYSTRPKTLTEEDQYVVQFSIGDLEPGTTYEYRVLINGKAVAFPDTLEFHTQPLWQWRTDPPPFRVVTGSCAYINDPAYDRPGKPYGARYDIFDRMSAHEPDMMLWLGDNVYLREADYGSRWGMAERYRHDRALPELQSLLRSTHHYAIWDDHEYGPNDSNQSFSLKNESLALFKRYWANPAYGLPGTDGIFSKFTFRDVDFFLLDNRYYRNDDHAPDTSHKVMLGQEQLTWLKDALLNSKAPFKIIANGSQMFNELSEKEGWNHFPEERSAFVDWLNETDIPGVMFMSGDVHYSALLKLDRVDTYPIYELTCSPLTSGPRTRKLAPGKSLLVPDTFVGQRNFCQLDFSGPRTNRNLKITVFNADGKIKWTKEIAAKELR